MKKGLTTQEAREDVQTQAEMQDKPAQDETPETSGTAEMPQPDKTLMRQQNYQQRLQQASQRIAGLRQQRSMIDDEITSMTNQTQQLVGALKEMDAAAPQEQKG